MYRNTLTFLVIFLLINHEFAAARHFNMPNRDSARMHYREAQQKASDMELDRLQAIVNDDMKGMGIHPDPNHHTREKRKWGVAVRAALSGLAGVSFGASVGITIYSAARKCNDFKPSPCLYPNCTFLVPNCPDVCKNPDTNRAFVVKEKENVRARLDLMDSMQLSAFTLSTRAISASLNNKQILIEINRINQKVESFMFKMVEFDLNVAERFRNNSVAIRTLVRNHKLTLDDIVASPEIQGIFDKWTWEGTGMFVISLALPVGLKFFSVLRERFAINKIATEMKADFANRFVAQKSYTGTSKISNKFAANMGMNTNNVNKQIYKAAKAQYFGDKALVKTTKVERFTQNVVGPLINLIVIAFSFYAGYKFFTDCQIFANDLQNTALTMANKMNVVEDLMKTRVEPLFNDVKAQAWDPVKEILTNETMLSWLAGIRNLTEGANNVNQTTIDQLTYFMNNIDSADVAKTMTLQKQLIDALEHVEFEIDCLEGKQHAIVEVLKDCRAGQSTLPTLYQEAATKFKLNVQACIDKKMVPYTDLAQFTKIVEGFSQHQGWYSDCPLNNVDLRDRVCDQKLKGYTTIADIIYHANRTGLTSAMVTNFLTRCPPPKITPKGITDTCKLHCLYETPKEIAKTVILLESQVNEIITKMCNICVIRQDQQTKICNLHFCKGENASTIEPQVRVPLTSVEHYIAKVCVQKCIVTAAVKTEICTNFKCKALTPAEISTMLAIPVSTVNEVTPNCDTLVPTCPTTQKDIDRVLALYCAYGLPPATISSILGIGLQIVEMIIATNSCTP